MYAVVKYEEEEQGAIMTDRNMTLDECLSLLGIDINEMDDPNTPRWDWELFEVVYMSDAEYHATR